MYTLTALGIAILMGSLATAATASSLSFVSRLRPSAHNVDSADAAAAPAAAAAARKLADVEVGGRPEARGVPLPPSSAPQLLAQLEQLNVVGVAAHPTAAGGSKVLYADETSIYELDVAARSSRRLAGAPTAGLLASRQPVDGRGALARFVYITKLVVRGGRVFVFDNDRLRELNARTLTVRTLALLAPAAAADGRRGGPVVAGTVSWDGSRAYWLGAAAGSFGGRMRLMQVSLTSASTSAASRQGGAYPWPEPQPVIGGGAWAAAYADVTADERYLLLSNVEASAVQRIDLADGTLSTLRSSSNADAFVPGPLVARRNGDVVVVNSALRTVEIVGCPQPGDEDDASAQLAEDAAPRWLADPSGLEDDAGCATTRVIDELNNPQDVAVVVVGADGDDDGGEQLLALDASFHPRLPTYVYSVKRLQL